MYVHILSVGDERVALWRDADPRLIADEGGRRHPSHVHRGTAPPVPRFLIRRGVGIADEEHDGRQDENRQDSTVDQDAAHPRGPDPHQGIGRCDKHEGQDGHVLLGVPVAGVGHVGHQVEGQEGKDWGQVPGPDQREEKNGGQE